MTRTELFANIKTLAENAYDNTDEDEVQSWDAWETAKQILVEMQAFGYDIAEMLEQIAEDAEET